MIRYLIATHSHLEGVRLSKAGNWGNIPYDTDAEAIAAAEVDARGKPHRIDRISVKRRTR